MASSCSVPRRSAFTSALHVAVLATSFGVLRHTQVSVSMLCLLRPIGMQSNDLETVCQ